MCEWYWYVAQPNELFVDMDRVTASLNHVRRRLQGAIECESLHVQSVYFYPSLTKDHAHLIIVLKFPISNPERYAWEMLLHGDIYRAASNIMRWSHGIDAPDVLIARRRLHRMMDGVCFCEHKHKRAVMIRCETARRLRGEMRAAQFFGKPSDKPCEFSNVLSYDVTQYSDIPLP